MRKEDEKNPFRSRAEVLAAKLLDEAEIDPDSVITYTEGKPDLTPARENYGPQFASAFRQSVETHYLTGANGSGPDTRPVITVYESPACAEAREKAQREEKARRLAEHRARQNPPKNLHQYAARNRVCKGRKSKRRAKGKSHVQERIITVKERMG